MRQGHKQLFESKLWGRKFWSAGYFHRTVGAITTETVKHYITEGQKKHWVEMQESSLRSLKTNS